MCMYAAAAAVTAVVHGAGACTRMGNIVWPCMGFMGGYVGMEIFQLIIIIKYI